MPRAAAALLALVLLAGCQSGQDPTVDAGAGTGAQTSAPPTAKAPPISTPSLAPRSFLTAVRASASDRGDGGSRVVFEFDPVVPGYNIDYVDRPVTEDGSGNEVAVQGEALLQVRMENAAAARIDGEKVTRTYTGPKTVAATGTGGVVTEVVDAGDFEGVVTWVVGLSKKVPELTVSSLTGPSRLVIDVPPPPAG